MIDDQGVVQDRATNIAFERLLDYDPADTGGHIFWERYVGPSDKEEVRAEIERVIAGEEPRELDSRWVASAGGGSLSRGRVPRCRGSTSGRCS